MAVGSWVEEELDRSGALFKTVRHPQAVTAQELAQTAHMSGKHTAKVVAALADDRRVMLVLPAHRHLAWPDLQLALNARSVRLAQEGEMARWFPECELGAEPPLRHWPDVEVWMDESLASDGDILFPGGTHAESVRMRFDDWFRLVGPIVARFTF